MDGAWDKIRSCMVQYLTEHEVQAVTAWPEGGQSWRPGPVAAVSLRECRSLGSGFGDYLGERYDTESGHCQELYGKRLEVRLGLDLYAAEEGAAQRIQESFDKLMEAMQSGRPAGLKMTGLTCGETGYDQNLGLYCRPAEAVCIAYLYAVAEEGGAFLDFEIKGEWEK